MEKKFYQCEDVLMVRSLHQNTLESFFDYPNVVALLSDMVNTLADAFSRGDLAACIEIRNCHPTLAGKSNTEILNYPMTLEDHRLTVAREFGYFSWQEVVQKGAHPLNESFEQAVDLLIFGDILHLEMMIDQDPTLLSRHSQFGHRAGLVHYIGSNGVEVFRQVVPANLVAITQMLLEKGADLAQPSNIYGRNSRLKELVDSSAHPWDAGIGKELMAVIG